MGYGWLWVKIHDLGDHIFLSVGKSHPMIGIPDFDPYPHTQISISIYLSIYLYIYIYTHTWTTKERIKEDAYLIGHGL